MGGDRVRVETEMPAAQLLQQQRLAMWAYTKSEVFGFFLKGPIVNISDFAGQSCLIYSTQLCLCSRKAARDPRNIRVWQWASTTIYKLARARFWFHMVACPVLSQWFSKPFGSKTSWFYTLNNFWGPESFLFVRVMSINIYCIGN